MTVLFDLAFADYSAGDVLQNIDSNWYKHSGGVNFGLSADKRLTPLLYTGAIYSYVYAGPIHWEIDVYADDTSPDGPAWYFGVGTTGSNNTTGARVAYDFGNTQWRISEEYSLLGTVSDNWWSQGNSRKLILDWDPTAGTLTLTVMDGATTVGSSTATGITSDGDYLHLSAQWNSIDYTSITLLGMMATDGAEDSNLPLKAYASGVWVSGTLHVRQSGAWVAGVLKRFNGTDWE